MDLDIILLLGLALGALLALKPNLLVITITSIYWILVLLKTYTIEHALLLTSRPWLSLLNINIDYHIDGLSKLFTILISSIGIIVLFYSYIYTQPKPANRHKLLALLQIFAVSMFAIVINDDLIMLFLFWELTTIVSYLLIQFHQTDPKTNQAAFTGLFITVFGGLCLLSGFIILNDLYHSWTLTSLIHSHIIPPLSQLRWAFILILIGVCTKSAQFPFHFWLPGAMKAPTPVSAYLHSATMVNAGIYLLARLHPVFGDLTLWYPTLASIGLTTMLLSSIIAMIQEDIKSLLAYTTLFALGAMVYLLATNSSHAIEAFAIFFIFHGLYKAGAFMLVGTIDVEYQTRKLSQLKGIAANRPLLAISIFILFGSLAGLPPFFGFTVKEMIFDAKLAGETISYFIIFISLLASMLITAASLHCAWLLIKPSQPDINIQKPLHAGLTCPLIIATLIVLLSTFTNKLRPIFEPVLTNILDNVPISYVQPNTLLSFILSLVVVIGGILLCIYYMPKVNFKISLPRHFSFEYIFQMKISYCISLGKLLTDWTQSKNINRQLIIILITMSLLMALACLSIPHLTLILSLSTLKLDTLVPSLLLLALSIHLLINRKFLSDLVILSLMGLVISGFFAVHGAIDVAITQLIVEILSIILILQALHSHAPEQHHLDSRINLLHLLVAAIVGILVFISLSIVNNTPFNKALSSYYIQNSLVAAYGRNIVNVILVDFRALDTFGEVIVILGSTVGITVLIKKVYQKGVALCQSS